MALLQGPPASWLPVGRSAFSPRVWMHPFPALVQAPCSSSLVSCVTRPLFFCQEDIDLKALGFDMAEGVNEPCLPGDCGIFVTKVDKGSIADGRLR